MRDFQKVKLYFHKEDMWIEELLEHDRPISIRFRDIRETDAFGSIRPSASTAGLSLDSHKYLWYGLRENNW